MEFNFDYDYNFLLDSVIVRKSFETNLATGNNWVTLTPIGNDRFLGALESTLNKPNGALFLYDYNLDTIMFIHVFSGGNDGKYPRFNLVEVNPGVYVGAAVNCIYKYNVNTSTYTSVSTSGTDAEHIHSKLAVDVNKYIYGITDDGYFTHIVRMTNQRDSISFVYSFDTIPGLNIAYFGSGFNYSNNGNFYCIGAGLILEYNPLLNKLTQKANHYLPSTGFLTLAPTSLGFVSIQKEKLLIKVNPNPADDYIVLKSIVDIENVKIYNSEGKLVLIKESSIKSLRLDISMFKPGLYLLAAKTTKKGTQYSKFIKK